MEINQSFVMDIYYDSYRPEQSSSFCYLIYNESSYQYYGLFIKQTFLNIIY